MGVYREPIKITLEQELNLTIAELNKTLIVTNDKHADISRDGDRVGEHRVLHPTNPTPMRATIIAQLYAIGSLYSLYRKQHRAILATEHPVGWRYYPRLGNFKIPS